MATYLLDTNIIIHVLRGKKDRKIMLERLIESDHLLASCPITIAEVYSGMHPKEEEATRAFLDALQFLPITAAVAEMAGRLKREWSRKGRTLSLADAMLAAVAIAHRCTLVTENVKDFPMPELVLHYGA